ncbi:hypothetical protein [Flavobacterium lacus]|jgi:hypothetical protein|uniref:YhhN-like protein n=1 Tax=Flavobacterium lacus TaxID=1353778 RepID=A0A328WXA4_9FLAO|nr:hypothetical protein [Flavobacterium lacus]RAR49047.1 hypothetical protein B0I10_104188 [Flavobacterium lacus]
MKEYLNNWSFKVVSSIYLVVVLLLVFVVFFDFKTIEFILKSISIPVLLLLYVITSVRKNKLYLFALFSAAVSNILFISTDSDWLNYGLFAFLIYRIITIILVIKASTKLSFFTVGIGSVFFLFPLLYFIVLTQDSLGQSFLVAIINVVLVSILGGLSLSNYLMEEGFKHTWLLISTFLYTIIVFLFVIQKYYVFIPIFQPIRVLVLMSAHYFFYLYILMTEQQLDKP